MRVGLSWEHTGRVRRRNDPGAVVDLDGDGSIGHDEPQEVTATLHIWMACRTRLLALGHEVIIFADGEYSDRHRRANDYDVDAYLALHINAGGGNYGAFLHHPKSRPGNGPRLARELSQRLSRWGRKRLGAAFPVKTIAADPKAWGNALYTISDLKAPVGICCEPFFLDNPRHRQAFLTPDSLAAIGTIYADALHAWGQTLT